MQKIAHQTRSFEDFTLDLTRGCLLRENVEVKLRPKSFEVLKYLVENSGRLVSKDELIQAVWPDTFVTDNSLVQCLIEVRRALGDEAQQCIKTVPRRGYVFEAQVMEGSPTTTHAVYTEQVEGVKVIIEEERDVQERPTEISHNLLAPASLASRLRRWRPSLKVLTFSALIVGLVSAVSYLLIPSPPKQVETVAKRPETIAILPFKPLSQDGKDEYLELGMADALITKLSNLRQIIVRPTSAVRKYTAQEQDPIAVGRELRVDSVLEGSIQRLGDRIRVTVQLVSVGDGKPLWAEKFDEKFTDIFAVQDSISERVAGALALELTGEEQKRLVKRYTDNTEAYQLYLKGVYFSNKRTEDGLKKAIEYFQQAIKIDPNYALAYAGLAQSYGPLGYLGYLPPNIARPKMKEAAIKALEIDDMLAEAHTSLGAVKLFYEWDWLTAEKEFRRAIELNPNYGLAHQWYGVYLFVVKGDQGAGIAEKKRALEIDPLSLPVNLTLGWLFYLSRRYDLAVEQYRKTLELEANSPQAHSYLGSAYEQKGMYEDAMAEYLKAASLSGAPGEEIAALKETYAVSGWRGCWQKRLAQLKEQSKRKYVKASDMAKLYLRLGEKDQAFDWLEKAYKEGDPLLIYLKVEPPYDGLRSDPRFADLLRRVGLAP